MSLLRHSSLYFIARALPAILAIPAIAVYTRLLSPEEFGIYVALMTIIGLGQSVLISWAGVTALRLLPQTRDRDGFLTGLAICYGATLLLSMFASGLILLFGIAWPVVAAGAATFAVMCAVDLQLFVLRADIDSKSYLSISILRAILTLVIGICAAYFGFGATGLVLSNLAGSALPLVLLSARIFRNIGRRSFSSGEFREILAYGLPLAGGFMSEAAAGNADRLLLPMLRGPEAAGIYGSAYGLASRLMTAVTDPIGTAGFSIAIQKLETVGSAAAAEQLRRNLIILLAIGMPLVAGIITVAPDLIEVLLGAAFRQGATALLPIIIIFSLLIALRQQYCEACFHIARRTKLYAVLSLATAFVSYALGTWGVSRSGDIGAAYAMLATQAFSFGLTSYVGNRVFPVGFPVRSCIALMCATLAMAIFVQIVPSGHGIYSLLGRAALGAPVYSAILLAFDIGGCRSVLTGLVHRTLRGARK